MTAKVIEHKKYVCADALNNNNKFWEYLLHDDGTVIVKYGRVGSTCNVDDPKKMTRKELDTKIAGKTKGRGKIGTAGYKPPYREVTVVAESSMPTGPTAPSLSKAVLATAAHTQLAANNPALTALVTRLVEANKHELYKASGGQMDIDLSTGIISTPVGVVTKTSVAEARQLLDSIAPFIKKNDFDDKKFIEALNSYLMLVPQKVGHSRGWHHSFVTNDKDLQRQSTLLDQLEASADLAEARKKAALTSAVTTSITSTPNLFNAKLTELEDKAKIKMITDKFLESINKNHESRNLRPIKFYEVSLNAANEAWETDGAKLKNQWLLWHGTRIFNVLSILKSGLILPGSLSTMQIAGAMFGNGLYFSDQSTKSLNYSYGYWDRSSRDKNCFMFMFDVAMGEYYVPKGSYESLPKRGYDSTFAKASLSGVMNNECIVYRTSQARPRYLIEFDEKR